MNATLLSVLLCLLSPLMKIHSQTVPYISFNNVSLPNNSYVNFSLVGDASGVSVQCHTDLVTCCKAKDGQSGGDWYYPNGHRLVLPTTNPAAPLFQKRQNMVVKLFRRNKQSSTSGIYRCDIETGAANNNSRETVYVGLYFSGGNITVQSMTLNSDLEEELTLTCISTGGPATTVTWTRDSEKILGGTTVLNNATNAQYTHTLTSTERKGRMYQCTVSNDKPSQHSASMSVKAASAPTNLMAVQDGSTGIRVSWTPPTPLGDTIGYRIYYNGGSNGSVDVSDGSTYEYLLFDLQNGSRYTISIVGTSEHLPSNPVSYPNEILLGTNSQGSGKVGEGGGGRQGGGHAYSRTEGCEYTAAVGGGVVGGFVSGVLITAVVGTLIFFVLLRRMRTTLDAKDSPSGATTEQRGRIPTSTNLAYGHVEAVTAAEYEVCVPSGVATATQEPTYETVLT